MTETFQPELVKKNYDDMPYPPRRPQDESIRLFDSLSSNLLVLNHHCYRGSRDFRRGFRCLVAGGGTGDDVIYLAEQLRHFNAEVVYLDVSAKAQEIAEQRARVRGLENIVWLTGSLMELPQLGLGQFDFVHCGGVLHHIDPIEDGLAALRAVTRDDGAIFLMLYGKYGKRPVYEMQDLLKEFFPPGISVDEKISIARRLIADLPASNRFGRDMDRWESEISPKGLGDVGLFFLLLHSAIPSFDVPELYRLAASSGLRINSFIYDPESYDPLTMLTDPDLRSAVARRDLPARQSIAEKLGCKIHRHGFFLTVGDDVTASLDDPANTLVAFRSLLQNHKAFAASMIPGRVLNYEDGSRSFKVPCTPVTQALFANMDGKTSIGALCKHVAAATPGTRESGVMDELRDVYEMLHAKGFVYLIREGCYGVAVPDYLQLR